MDVQIEKRLHKRSRKAVEVHCGSFGLDEIFVSRDVGGGGLFLNAPNPLPAGSEVSLSFSLSPGSPPFECTGRVVYSLPGVGMGIHFIDVRGQMERALDQLSDRIQ